MTKTICLMVLFLIASVGCLRMIPAFHAEIWDGDTRRAIPKRPKFSIPLNDYSDSAVLDFDAVYYYTFPSHRYTNHTQLVEIGTGYHYYRFWPTGHVSLRPSVHVPPSALDGDDFYEVKPGRYLLGAKNEITLEFFCWHDPQMDYGYM